jgi:aryl-phospho-beta-D-glucosidase BglC (GH1 family)
MSAPQRFAQEGPLRVERGAFVDRHGARFTFRGVSWFGFDGKFGFLDGLNKAYNGRDLDSALVRDWKVVAARIKLLGFNTIRLPFAWSVRAAAACSSFPRIPLMHRVAARLPPTCSPCRALCF